MVCHSIIIINIIFRMTAAKTHKFNELEETMTSKQRSYLKSLASTLDPVFQVGKSSLTPEVTAAIGECFNTRELIKVAVLKNCLDDPKEIAQVVAERTHSQVVQVIGRKFILYKPDKKKPKIVLPKA